MTTDKKPLVWINIGIPIKDIRIDGQEVIYKSTNPTYTDEDIKGAFEAGLNRDYYEQNKDTNAHFAPDFEQFMNELYTYKKDHE